VLQLTLRTPCWLPPLSLQPAWTRSPTRCRRPLCRHTCRCAPPAARPRSARPARRNRSRCLRRTRGCSSCAARLCRSRMALQPPASAPARCAHLCMGVGMCAFVRVRVWSRVCKVSHSCVCACCQGFWGIEHNLACNQAHASLEERIISFTRKPTRP